MTNDKTELYQQVYTLTRNDMITASKDGEYGKMFCRALMLIKIGRIVGLTDHAIERDVKDYIFHDTINPQYALEEFRALDIELGLFEFYYLLYKVKSD